MFITYTSTGSYRAEDGQGLLTQALGWAGDGVSVQQCKDEPSHHDVPAPRSHEPSSEGQDSESFILMGPGGSSSSLKKHSSASDIILENKL